MKHASRIVFLPIILLLAVVFLGSGCSHDNSTAPVDLNDNQVVVADQKEPLIAGETVTFIETFDDSSNVGNWSFYDIYGFTYESSGGNPGWYLHDPNLVSFCPHPGTALGASSVFTGNYKLRNVTSIGIDLRSIDYLYDISGRYTAVKIMNDNGTPDDGSDDWGAYCVGTDKVPSKYVSWKIASEPGWVSYDFAIDAQSKRLPSGWSYYSSNGDGSRKTSGSWSQLMENVSYIQFTFGDPTQVYFINEFDLGIDNPRITYEE